jgi:hypothetical protein
MVMGGIMDKSEAILAGSVMYGLFSAAKVFDEAELCILGDTIGIMFGKMGLSEEDVAEIRTDLDDQMRQLSKAFRSQGET